MYIYLEPKWPLCLKVNPTKQGLFQPKQGSFEFQVYNRYIYIYIQIYICIIYGTLFCLPHICSLLLGFNPPTSAGWCPPTVNLLERKCCSPTKKGKSYQTKQVFRALLVRLHQLASYSLPPVHNKVNTLVSPRSKNVRCLQHNHEHRYAKKNMLALLHWKQKVGLQEKYARQFF